MPRLAAKEVEQRMNQDKEPVTKRKYTRRAPVVIRKMTESQEQKVGQDGVREFNKDNELPHLKTESAVDISGTKRRDGSFRDKKWLDDMAFANEMVTVMVHESTDKNANPFPEVSVNGRVQRFVRGHEQQVRRCYVEKLARLKLTTYGNLKTKDVDGEDVYRYPSATGLLYPFVLINPTARDTAWLKGILAEQ